MHSSFIRSTRLLTHCFSFSHIVPTRIMPTPPPPLKLVATVKLNPYTHTSFPIFILLSTPHPLKSLTAPLRTLHKPRNWPHFPGQDEMGSLQAGAVGTAPVVRPSLDCPGLVWRPTAGQARGAGRRPETETRFGAE